MSRVYSTQIFNGDASQSIFEYVVPVGQVLVIRDLQISQGGETAIDVILGINGYAVVAFQEVDQPAGLNITRQWSGRLVCNPGDTVTLNSFYPAGVNLSGYLLNQS